MSKTEDNISFVDHLVLVSSCVLVITKHTIQTLQKPGAQIYSSL